MASNKYAGAGLAATLIAAFFLQSIFASRMKSPTSDEPPHIAAGLSNLHARVFYANPQHPPLLKELSAASLLLAGVRWPKSPRAQALIAGATDPDWRLGLEWPVGNEIIAANGPDRVMFWARLPFVLVASLLGFLIYVWGRKLVGETAALGAVFLYALDPTILAHSYLVTTDVGCAAFTLLFLFALWNYLRRPALTGLLMCGAALGAALGAKFSAIALVPVAAALMIAAAWLSGEKPPAGSLFLRRLAANGLAFLGMCVVAAVVVEAVYLFPRNPLLYVAGIQQVNADHIANYPHYMAGRIAHHFDSYFVVAYLLKEPAASIILAGLGLLVTLRTRAVTPLDKLFLVFPPAVLLAGYSLAADDLGIRYIIPVLPFAYLIGGMGLALLVRTRSIWTRGLAGVLCAWLVVAAIGIYPDHLAYFNEAACLLQDPGQAGLDGGTACGPQWLDDSNVDWGQGLKQLKWWLDDHAKGTRIRLYYFGSFPPASYGIPLEPGTTGFEWQSGPAADLQSSFRPPGVVVVSSHIVARVPAMAAGSWLHDMPPDAIVGHSLYVYGLR
ncbi:MAG TPA: glycosyltransferase family 39 protein [Bryobacteraceae bacterium]|nr:glycosyltransferase family 39 protein [Bryobacteraceae bacterium]